MDYGSSITAKWRANQGIKGGNMKSSKNAHKVMHRRTTPPPIGENTVKRWGKVARNMSTVVDEAEAAKKVKGRTPSKRLSKYSAEEEIKPSTLADIWPEGER